jgi:mannose-6-phosphate isomerase-like protein (cupin superfamily)
MYGIALFSRWQSLTVKKVFYVISGAVQVQVHRTSFIMAPGAMFMVPRGWSQFIPL